MKYTYEEKQELNIVIRTSENGEIACIPTDPANSDYQRYLKWVENPDAEEQVLTFPIITEPLTE